MQLCCAMKKISKLLATYIIYYNNSLFIFHGKDKEILEIILNYSFKTKLAIFKCYEIGHLNALK